MDIADSRRRKVVVDNDIDVFEIDTATHEFRADQDPNVAFTESFNSFFSLQKDGLRRLDTHLRK